jgi:hypothetical protein
LIAESTSMDVQRVAVFHARRRGLGEPGEVADLQGVMDWLSNRTLPLSDYIAAAGGDVAALARVRAEAGLPVFS